MFRKISNTVFQLSGTNFGSYVYLITLKEPVLIDLGSFENKEQLKKDLEKLNYLNKIKKIILTHLHWDHIGGISIFKDKKDIKFYASEKEINSFKKFKQHILGIYKNHELEKIKLNPLKKLEGFEIIETPGHTTGSIALFYKKEKTLFTGDTLFENNYIGRTDFINSAPEKMQNSLNKLKKIKYKILCPGH